MNRESLKIKAEAQVSERAETTTFVKVDDIHFEVNGLKMSILKNYREAFDELKFKARFSDVLTKYDYIVGDIAADQLRLKGFYRPENQNGSKINSITAFEDYLYEYINFGAPYFVIENETPVISQTDFEVIAPVNNRRRKRSNRREREEDKQPANEGNNRTNKHRKSSNRPKNENNAINDNGASKLEKTGDNPNRRRKRRSPQQRPEIKETRKPVGDGKNIKKQDGSAVAATKQRNQRKRHFTIRQKSDTTIN